MLTPAQLALLKTELTIDPMTLGYASRISSGNDQGVLSLVTDRTKGGVLPQAISSANLILWASMTGVLSKIVAGTTNASGAVASLCLGAQSFLQGGLSQLDITLPVIAGTNGFLDDLTGAGILNASGPGSKADLINFGSVPASRADVVLGYGIVPALVDIAVALRGNN